MVKPKKNPAAVALGKKGGAVKSERKKLAAQANARRPRSSKRALSHRAKYLRPGDKIMDGGDL
jgi:hypothetical protein